MKQKNQNRYNIKLFNKNKSNTAITLIALIVTIIVLLILAGITLNMIMGENGIFEKANNAKNRTEISQYEEELRLCMLELQTDESTNGTTFNMNTIKDKFKKKVTEIENTDDIEFPTDESETKLSGTYKGYEFYIDEKYVAHIGDKAVGISLITSLDPKGWTQGPVTATITIKSSNGISKIATQDGEPISLNGEKEYKIKKENIAENQTYTYEVTDTQGNMQTKTAIINTIDKLAPNDFAITAESTDKGIEITANATDAEATEKYACSGIDKYEYYVKNSTESMYNKYETNLIELECGTYSVYAIAYDKAKNQKQSENITVKVSIKFDNVVTGPNSRFNVGVGKNGKIYTVGNNFKPMILNSEEINIEKISVGYAHTLILDKDGKIWGFGSSSNGQLGIDKKQVDIPVQIDTRNNRF